MVNHKKEKCQDSSNDIDQSGNKFSQMSLLLDRIGESNPEREENLQGSKVRIHDPNIEIESNPDTGTTRTIHRIGRLISEEFSGIGGYINAVTREIQGEECSIYVKDPFEDEAKLEHHLTVRTEGDNNFSIERSDGADDEDILNFVLNSRRPIISGSEISIVFEDLDKDNDECDVYEFKQEENIAYMPFYYRKPDKTSGIAVFKSKDELGPKDSDLEGFNKLYWTAKAAINSAVYIAHTLTHKFDNLTALAGREDFKFEFTEKIEEQIEQEKNTYFAIVDLDDFKKINDTYGHRAGDKVLEKTSYLMENSLRENDQVYRIGGEEFGIIIDDVKSDIAETIAKRVRKTIEEERIEFENLDTEIDVTCSIGVAKMSSSFEDLEEARQSIYESADNALYKAKKKGKNRVVMKDK